MASTACRHNTPELGISCVAGGRLARGHRRPLRKRRTGASRRLRPGRPWRTQHRSLPRCQASLARTVVRARVTLGWLQILQLLTRVGAEPKVPPVVAQSEKRGLALRQQAEKLQEHQAQYGAVAGTDIYAGDLPVQQHELCVQPEQR